MNYFLVLACTLIIVLELIRFSYDKKRHRLWILIVPVLKICLYTQLGDYFPVVIATNLNTGLTGILLIYYYALEKERRKKGVKYAKFGIIFAVIIVLIFPLQIALHVFFFEKGLSMYKVGNYENSIKYFDKAIAIDKRNYTAYYAKGEALDKLRRYDEAIQYYDKAISLKPNIDALHNSKGLTLYNEKKYDDAILEYNKAIELNSKAYASYYNRGLAYSKLGKNENAIKDLQETLSLKPNDQKAAKLLKTLTGK
ncbi:tetratricopeptide repeat protein [Clostridium magnum]|uniref:TPR repeat-containing protein YrrB n=1 Tax=Clostridium magnum DSM 2767 TaxID=1121326 RepID=A0A162TS98_9CLOT|nr:tetratricopeptide repeat protein [Clostridium magnum]KZL92993.1 TPR repeat-containing protein YrrB [Clostridium magnum DSM 2767]SHJ22728.1 TPR repeat-containing protein [Clostridium magnum DSM 2767]